MLSITGIDSIILIIKLFFISTNFIILHEVYVKWVEFENIKIFGNFYVDICQIQLFILKSNLELDSVFFEILNRK